MNNNPWIWRPKPALGARILLLCIPHAGGTAGAFRPWAAALPEWIDVVAVQLPGRQQRAKEPMPTRMGMLVRELAAGIEAELDMPYALLGSCTGSLIAYELAQLLHKRGRPTPLLLCATSCRAPQLPDRDAPIHQLDDDELRRELARLGGTATALLEHPEMMRLFGPTLRRDFELAETYSYRPRPPLEHPIIAFGGTRDTVVSHAEREAWREHTGGRFEHLVVDGGHYLVDDAAAELCSIVAQRCAEVLK